MRTPIPRKNVLYVQHVEITTHFLYAYKANNEIMQEIVLGERKCFLIFTNILWHNCGIDLLKERILLVPDYTRVGARRAGDDYQDIVALDVLVEMLEHPDRYSYVALEAYQEARSLDDVLAVRSDGTVVAKQIKFSTNPTSDVDPWTWGVLLSREQGKRGMLDSLLKKWQKSVSKLSASDKAFTAHVISNRLPGPDLAQVLKSDGHIDFDKIPDEIKTEILAQIGSEPETRVFFSHLCFELDRPGLEVMEESIYKRFRNLGGTDDGWDGLKSEVRHWVCHKTSPPPDGKIRLDDIKAAAKWRQLEGLPQDFEVPDDYVLPSRRFLAGIYTRIRKNQKGCYIITGLPGVGKSTFLSYLYNNLWKKGVPVVRHHYFLSMSRQSIGRFDYLRVASSLMQDISFDYNESLGTLSRENPDPHDLGKWIKQCGIYFNLQGKSLVVILDGLDHVWRERRSIDDLNALLEHFLPVQEGVILLIGTQPLFAELMPPRLLSASPEMLELPLLEKKAVQKWVNHHSDQIPLPDDEIAATRTIERIADSFFARSEGHPLHLTYTLRALLEQGIPIEPERIEELPSCSHRDITTYYNQLWTALDENGREILHLFSATQFPWEQQWIIECLDPEGLNIPSKVIALKQARHLLVDRGVGLLPFHGSLIVYIQGLHEHALYSTNLKGRAIRWLETKAPEYWKWSYLWILKADIGDPETLVSSPCRDWIIDSIEKAYPQERITEILSSSARIALGCNLPRCVEVGLLNDYVSSTLR